MTRAAARPAVGAARMVGCRRPSTVPSSERGSAMLIAIGVLLVMSILAGVAVQAAVAGSDGSNGDARAKQAFQAAESGLRAATYRTTMLQPAPEKCVVLAVAVPSGGLCGPTPSEALGNGSSFTYRTTPALTEADRCAGLSVRTQNALTQRCVTATGTTDGVTRRLQTRIAAYAATPLFPVAGILGLRYVELKGNVQIPGTTVATNGALTLDGNVEIGDAIVGPKGKVVEKGNTTTRSQTTRTSAQGPYVLSPVDPGTSATTNSNGRIVNGLKSPPVSPYDAVSSGSGLTYDASKRALKATGNTTLTLGGGVYNFCSISVAGNFNLVIASGAKVSIYVDSPDNPNSGCPAGSGGMSISGNLSSGSSDSDPTALQFYVYGTNDGAGRLDIRGNSTLRATIYAPQSLVTFAGNTKLIGGIAAGAVELAGNSFQYDDRAGGLQTGSVGTYYRTAWRECPSKATAGAPGAC